MTDEYPGGVRHPYARPLLWNTRMTDNPASELSARPAAAPRARRPGGLMSSREQPDPVERMRQRWLEHDEPKPEHFAAMAALLRMTILVTDEMDRVLKECQLSRTGYLILITLQASREQTLPLG